MPFYGAIHLNLDDSNVVSLIPDLIRPVRTFGIKSQADTRADNIIADGTATDFDLYYHDYRLGHIHLPLPGVFNVKNALAAISVALEFDIPFETIKKALESFKGVNRRFDLIGEQNGIKVYDDYAHHPTEIDVTLRAAKVAFKSRVIVVFQPHLFSRTRDFYQEFAKSLLMCDMLILAKLYPAREEPIAGVTSQMISDAAAQFGHKNVRYHRGHHQDTIRHRRIRATGRCRVHHRRRRYLSHCSQDSGGVEKMKRPLPKLLFLFSLLLLGRRLWQSNPIRSLRSKRSTSPAATASPRTICRSPLGKTSLISTWREVVNAVYGNHFVESVSAKIDHTGKLLVKVVEKVPVAYIYLDDLYAITARGELVPSNIADTIFTLPVIQGLQSLTRWACIRLSTVPPCAPR